MPTFDVAKEVDGNRRIPWATENKRMDPYPGSRIGH